MFFIYHFLFQILLVSAVVAMCNAGYLHHAPSITSSHNIVHHGSPSHYTVESAPALHTVHAAPVHSAPIAYAAAEESHAEEHKHYVDEHVS